MRICSGKGMLGAFLMLVGILLVFLCLPVEFFLIGLGLALTAAGILLLGWA